MSTPLYRLVDPGRGAFCDVDKNGNAVAMPPTSRMPMGPLHPGKTYQDRLPVSQRQRVQDADRRRSRMQEEAAKAAA